MSDFPTTDWTRYDVPAIASMLLDDDFADSWSQVHAWLAAYETISVHQSQLAKAQSELAEAWPPGKSPASAAYLEAVAALSSSMAETAEVAFANARAVANTLDALTSAQASIGRLHQEWHARAAASPSADTSHAAWATNLNAQARQIMHTTDQVVFENTQRLVAPAVMSPFSGQWDSETPIPAAGDPTATKERAQLDGTATARAGIRLVRVASTAPNVDVGNSSIQALNSPSSVEGGATSLIAPAAGAATALAGAAMPNFDRSRGFASGGSVPSAGLTNAGNGRASSNARQSTPSEAADTTAPARPRSSASSHSPDPSGADEMLAPGLGMAPNNTSSSRGTRRRRRQLLSLPDRPPAAPSLIVPRPSEPIVHDPGPGVIGIDR